LSYGGATAKVYHAGRARSRFASRDERPFYDSAPALSRQDELSIHQHQA